MPELPRPAAQMRATLTGARVRRSRQLWLLLPALPAFAVAACGSQPGGAAKAPPDPAVTGTVVVLNLAAHGLFDHAVTPASLRTAADIVSKRLHAAHIPSTVTVNTDSLRVTVPVAQANAASELATRSGSIRFRQVMAAGPSGPAGSQAPSARTQSPSPYPLPSPIPGSFAATLEGVQPAFATLDCSKTPNPTAGQGPAASYVLACDESGQTRYLLAPAAVDSSDVRGAHAEQDPVSGEPIVDLSFNANGTADFAELTRQAAQKPDIGSGCQPPSGCNAVAIEFDGVVLSAPRISDPNGILGGQAQIAGSFTVKHAKTLAELLSFGALPLRLERSGTTTESR